MLSWKKVYFDLDNTLFSYEYAFEKALQDCYQHMICRWKEQGRSVPRISPKRWSDVFKHYSDQYWPLYERKELSQQEYRRKRFLETMQHFQLPHTEEEADQFHAKFYNQAVCYVHPFPGLYSLLAFLRRQQVETGIITNGKYDIQINKIQQLNVEPYIPEERIFISENERLKKPSPALFDRVRGHIQPSQALFIGDTWEHDVVGALEAGWSAIYLNTQNKKPSTNHRPLAEFKSFSELLHYFQRLSG